MNQYVEIEMGCQLHRELTTYIYQFLTDQSNVTNRTGWFYTNIYLSSDTTPFIGSLQFIGSNNTNNQQPIFRYMNISSIEHNGNYIKVYHSNYIDPMSKFRKDSIY